MFKKIVVVVIFVLSINLSYIHQKYANKTYIDNVVKTFGLASDSVYTLATIEFQK